MDPLDVGILALAVLTALASLLAAQPWPPCRWLRARWLRYKPLVACYIRRSPATFGYAGVIFVTTWVLAGVSPGVSEKLLRSQSTNLDNLRTHAVDVLFRSAFWSGSTKVLPVIATLAAVLAPAEVWLGTRRVIAVFAIGHVGATLATAVAISHGYFTSSADGGIDRTVDVGISYGSFCVAAVLVHRLPRRFRLLFALALLVVSSVTAFVTGKTFTDFGHFVAVLIGFAVYPLIHSTGVDARARIPLYRPWRRPEPATQPARS